MDAPICLQNLLDKFGAGQLMEQLSELKLDELLSTPPPGLDEAIAISKVVEFVESEEYARFTRIVFDTAPTGHTLRMLSLPDFVAAALKKVQTLQSKLGTGGPLLQGIFGNPQGLQSSAEQLKKLEKRVLTVSRLFRYVPSLHSCDVPGAVVFFQHGLGASSMVDGRLPVCASRYSKTLSTCPLANLMSNRKETLSETD